MFWLSLTVGASAVSATDTASVAVIVVVGERAKADKDITLTRSDRTARLETISRTGLSVSDVVESIPSARVLDFGGPVHERRVAIRGGQAHQSSVVIDGISLSLPFATGFDVDALAPEVIERLEIVRGGAGTQFGDGALSGAIVIDTKPVKKMPRMSAAFSGGTFDTVAARAQLSTENVAAIGDVAQTNGRFAYVSRISGLPDETRIRENNDAALERFFLRWDASSEVVESRTFVGLGLRSGGLPGLETQANLHARELRTNGFVRSFVRPKLFDPSLGIDVDAALFGSFLDVDYRDDDPVDPRASRTTFVSGGVLAQAGFVPVEHHRTRIAADVSTERSALRGGTSRTRMRGSMFLSDRMRVGPTTWTLGFRGIFVQRDAVLVLPRLGLLYAASDAWTIRAGGGRSARVPTIDELDHPVEAGFSGNPSLVSETAWEGDFGLRWHAFRRDSAVYGWVEVVGFFRQVDDAIVYIHQNAFMLRPENASRSRVLGVELESEWGAPLGPLTLTFFGSFSWMRSHFVATDAPVPGVPTWSADFELSVSPRADEPPFSIAFRSHLSSAFSANLSGTLAVDPYARADVSLAVAAFRPVVLGILVSNVFDDQTLKTMHKVPLPGRAALVTVRWEVDRET